MARLARAVALAAAAGLAALLAGRLARDVGGGDGARCETTYLWEGYAQVALPRELAEAHPAYALHKFADQDPHRAAEQRALQRRASVPVLFVHGHMGSYQQMRSAASESGRELVRRLRAADDWALWLQWYAVDFAAEPSALEASLLARQARFVKQCVELLQQAHTQPASSSSPPQRVVLVGYSMGALVARAALHLLAAEPQFDVASVALLLTLASPPAPPAFMPPRAFYALLAEPLIPARAAQLAAVPRVSVVAGHADVMLPYTGTAAGRLAGELRADAFVAVGMLDVPAVWTSTTHKGIVSCNQLVRQLIPLLVAAVELALRQGPGPATAAATARLALQQLTGGVAVALRGAAEGGAAPCGPHRGARASPTAPRRTPGAAVLFGVRPGESVTLIWNTTQELEAQHAGLLVVAVGLQPCTEWAVQADNCSGGTRCPPHATLPPLLSSLRGPRAPLAAISVLEGINWLQNATSLAYVDFASVRGETLELAVQAQASSSPSAVVLAQLLPAHPAAAPLRLPMRLRATRLAQGHPAVVQLRLEQAWWSGKGVRWLMGCPPPLALHVLPAQCAPPLDQQPGEYLVPALVAVGGNHGGASETVDVGSARGTSAFALWRGGAPATLLLVSDPRCEYHLRLRWDLVDWLSLSLRHHLFALVPLAAAWCQLRGGALPAAGSSELQLAWAAAVAGAAAALSQSHAPGLHTWTAVSAVEAAALLTFATGVAAAAQAVVHAWAALTASWAQLPQQPWTSAPLLVLASASAVHPALAHLVGNAAGTAQRWRRSDRVLDHAAAARVAGGWLVACLPATQLAAWLLGGRRYRYASWSLERVALVVVGVHAWRGHGAGPCAWLAPVAATATALAALWGWPYIALHTSALLASCALVGWPPPPAVQPRV